MAKVVFVEGLISEEKQALTFLHQLHAYALKDSNYAKLLAYVILGIEHLENLDKFPVGTEGIYTTTLFLDGTQLELDLVKPLTMVPVLELRVDWPGIGCFRATYFPYIYKHESYYCFLKAFIKTINPPYDPTNHAMEETERLFHLFNELRWNPNEH